jgi:hypothetical protein
MAYDIRNCCHADYGTNYNDARFTEKGEDEWAVIRESNSPNRSLLQLELNLWKFDILVPQRLLHSNAQGIDQPHYNI